MEMIRANHRIIITMLVLLLAVVPVSHVKSDSVDLFEQQKLISHLLVNAFLEKVDEDGLTIFDHAIKRDDLISHHVAYVHQLGNDELKAQLCFMLSKNILVPDFEGFYVERIIVDMAKDGTIIEISTHVSPIEQGPEKGDESDKGQIQ